MPEIKERPILFSAPMVRAILEGRKTVTRRVVKGSGLNFLADFTPEYVALPENHFCPYGRRGERLWVRETHADIGCRLTYRADTDDGAHCQVKKWTPAIHMFRRHSRILLEITDVRVERLQDISEEQALAEGIIPHVRGGWHWHPHDPSNVDDWHQFGFKSPAFAFQDLWIGTGGDWDANPWIWVVEFKPVTP
ncbi:MAG TPA: hypothetical protein ENI30_00250 [Gammaproteobacteria bacterium]|jgi:hypothetical protein|nr:hypothetical protein [Gammaproteobacteria bacterium]